MNLNLIVALLIVAAAAASGLLTQVLNNDLLQTEVFATLKSSGSQSSQDDIAEIIPGSSPLNSIVNGETTKLHYSTTGLEGSLIDEPQGAPLNNNSNSTARLTQLPQTSQQRTVPDDDCLFNPALLKCAPIAGKCPPGFLMNEEEQCFPDKPCPPGYTKLDEDETGTCYPLSPTTSLMTNGSNTSSSDGSSTNE